MSLAFRRVAVADVLQIVQDYERYNPKSQRITSMLLEYFPQKILCDETRSEYLLQMHDAPRNEFLSYYYFTNGHLFNVIKHGITSREFSFINFPAHLEGIRESIQQNFFLAAKIFGACNSFWLEGTWDDYTEEQKAICAPVFVEDNLFPPSL